MRRMLFIFCSIFVVPALVFGQVREATIVFKDGFSIKGKVIQKQDYLIDKESGQGFRIPKDGTFQYLDDDVRRIHFSPHQAHDVIPSKQGETRKDLIQIIKQRPTVRNNFILPNWQLEKIGPWNDSWERNITINTGRGTVNMRERIIAMSPWQAYFMGVEYSRDQMYLTKELGVDFVLTMLYKHYGAQKEMTEIDRRLQIARFINQVGWYGDALRELEKLVKEYPAAKEGAQPQIDALKRLRATLFVEDIERTHRIGQHDQAQARIAAFYQDYLVKESDEKQQIIVQDLKTKYETAREKIQQAKAYLKELPPRLNVADRPFWIVAAKTIEEELTIDTLPRLETFLSFAQQHAREVQENKATPESAQQVLAIGVSGWLQGNTLADPDVKNANKLFRARLMLQEYMKTDGSVARNTLANSFTKEHGLPVDVIARMLKQMPPVQAFDKISMEKQTLNVELADAAEGSYLVQLPPDYNHQRQYPVMMLLQSPRDPAANLLERCKEMGMQHGYILVAPLWGKAREFKYEYSAKEHALVLDCLRDLRRRFNVDSDRVFLFGWEAGGTMAYDVGLSHPDQFAGVIPMNGSALMFATKYAANGQYLPFYVIDGDNNGTAGSSRTLFKTWVGGNYPSIYVEYKGRVSEWFHHELIPMFDWMNKKKRHHPARELGRGALVVGQGDEFKTHRECDNKYYWLGTNSISATFLNDAANWKKETRPATLTANIGVGNESGTKEARIWNQINIRTSGVKQLSIWLAPDMIDFTKPVAVRVNGQAYGNARLIEPSLATMLEEFYQSGDRQRLFYAKVDLKL